MYPNWGGHRVPSESLQSMKVLPGHPTQYSCSALHIMRPLRSPMSGRSNWETFVGLFRVLALPKHAFHCTARQALEMSSCATSPLQTFSTAPFSCERTRSDAAIPRNRNLTARNFLQVSQGREMHRPEAARRGTCTMPRTLLLITAAAFPAMAGAFAPALPLGGQQLGMRSFAQAQVPTPQRVTTGSIAVYPGAAFRWTRTLHRFEVDEFAPYTQHVNLRRVDRQGVRQRLKPPGKN